MAKYDATDIKIWVQVLYKLYTDNMNIYYSYTKFKKKNNKYRLLFFFIIYVITLKI